MLNAKSFSQEPCKITVQGDEYMIDTQSRLSIADLNGGLYFTFNQTRTYNSQGNPSDSDND